MTTNPSLIVAEIASLFKPVYPESRANLESTIAAKLQPLVDRLNRAERLAAFAACPKCHQTDLQVFHHQGSFALPECSFLVCNDCGNQWGHG